MNIPPTDATNYNLNQEEDDQVYIHDLEERIRSTSKRSSRRHLSNSYLMNTVSPLISRSVWAKRRQAFLRTYQLSHLRNDSVVTTAESNCSEKLKQAAIKLKSVIVSLTSAARLTLLRRGCSFRPAMCCASLPSSSSI